MSNTENTPSPSGGPYAAIVLGLIIIVGAIFLVMTMGKKDIEGGEAAAHSHDHGDHDHDHDHDHDNYKTLEKPAATPEGKPAEAAPAPAPAATDELAVLKLVLPNPAFAGTPKDAPKNTRMKPLTGKDREPYKAVPGLSNVAMGKPVTSSDSAPIIGDLELVTDDDKEPLDGRWVELAPGKQWVQIDLGEEKEVHVVMIWHNHLTLRVYRDVIVQLSNDPEFIEGVTTVFNNDYDNTSGMGAGQDFEYFENYEGLLVPVNPHKGLKARFVRCYSNGSTDDAANHVAEVEVWAK